MSVHNQAIMLRFSQIRFREQDSCMLHKPLHGPQRRTTQAKSLAYQKQTQLFSFKESFGPKSSDIIYSPSCSSKLIYLATKDKKAPLRQYIPSLQKLICFSHMDFLLICHIYDPQLGKVMAVNTKTYEQRYQEKVLIISFKPHKVHKTEL